MNPKTKKFKHLRLKLTTKEYSDFWYVVWLLGESKKKDGFLKMISKIKELYGELNA